MKNTHKAVLRNLLSQPCNQVCADCNAHGPVWASANLGVFICIRCSGIHRKIGTHISFVRSVHLDSWKPNHIMNMKRIGNGLANEYFEYHMPSELQKPTERSSVHEVETFIRNKYERKLWVRRKEDVDDNSESSVSSSSTSSSEASTPTSVPNSSSSSTSFSRPPRKVRSRRGGGGGRRRGKRNTERRNRQVKKISEKSEPKIESSSPPLIVFGDTNEKKMSRSDRLIDSLFSTKQTQQPSQAAFRPSNPVNVPVNQNRQFNSNINPQISVSGKKDRILGMFDTKNKNNPSPQHLPNDSHYWIPQNQQQNRNGIVNPNQQTLKTNKKQDILSFFDAPKSVPTPHLNSFFPSSRPKHVRSPSSSGPIVSNSLFPRNNHFTQIRSYSRSQPPPISHSSISKPSFDDCFSGEFSPSKTKMKKKAGNDQIMISVNLNDIFE